MFYLNSRLEEKRYSYRKKKKEIIYRIILLWLNRPEFLVSSSMIHGKIAQMPPCVAVALSIIQNKIATVTLCKIANVTLTACHKRLTKEGLRAFVVKSVSAAKDGVLL